MIHLYSQEEIKVLKKGGRILADILDELVRQTREGVTSEYINELALSMIKEKGADPSFLGYNGFPAAVCISVNNEVVHGLPKPRPFRKNDIVSLDLGIRYQGLCVDKATTFPIGIINQSQKQFLNTVKNALDVAIKQAKPGNKIGHISSAIQNVIEKAGYSVIKVLFGHGVGRRVHEEPKVPNFGNQNEGPVLREGMVLAIEPMAAMGSGEVEVLKDGFTIASADNSLTAHFEDTIAITKDGAVVLTRI